MDRERRWRRRWPQRCARRNNLLSHRSRRDCDSGEYRLWKESQCSAEGLLPVLPKTVVAGRVDIRKHDGMLPAKGLRRRKSRFLCREGSVLSVKLCLRGGRRKCPSPPGLSSLLPNMSGLFHRLSFGLLDCVVLHLLFLVCVSQGRT